jgi:peptidyl-prolyl cis-trans isomerase C
MNAMLKDKRNIIIFSILSIIVAAAFFANSNSSSQKNSEIVAKANGKDVHVSDVEQFLKAVYNWDGDFDFVNLPKENKEALIQQVVGRELLIKAAKKSSVASDEAIKSKIKNATDKIVSEAFIVKIGEDAVSDENIQERYESLSETLSADIEGKEELKAKHILVKTYGDAQQVIKDLYKQSFEEVAKEKSIDVQTAKNGGELGYFVEGRMVKEFSEAATKLKVGKISNPVKTKFGWHIIKLEDRRPAQIPSLDDVRAQIVQELSSEAIGNYMKNIVADANVEYNFAAPATEVEESTEEAE